MIILDTNVVSELMRPDPSSHVVDWVAGQAASDLYLSTVSQAELLYGVEMLPPGARRDRLLVAVEGMLRQDFDGRILHFDSAAARACAAIAARAPRRRASHQPCRLLHSGHSPLSRRVGRHKRCARHCRQRGRTDQSLDNRMNTSKLTSAVEQYLTDLRRIRASGGATSERSYYPPLTNLLNAIGSMLKPKVFCVGELAEQGAGHPDLGLYAARQVKGGKPSKGHSPERGVVEVKPVTDDAWLTASGEQVSKYWSKYRLVLVTNTRDFVLLGEDAAGMPAKLETFRLAGASAEFELRLEKPRALARELGAGLGEYLCRALAHSASITEPRDLAWLMASYARDGLARVEAAGDAPSLHAVRSALEEALGVRFEG